MAFQRDPSMAHTAKSLDAFSFRSENPRASSSSSVSTRDLHKQPDSQQTLSHVWMLQTNSSLHSAQTPERTILSPCKHLPAAPGNTSQQTKLQDVIRPALNSSIVKAHQFVKESSSSNHPFVINSSSSRKGSSIVADRHSEEVKEMFRPEAEDSFRRSQTHPVLSAI